MTAAVTLSETACWLEHEHDILPIMTALFVEGLEPRTNLPIDRQQWESERSEEIDAAKIFRLPITVKPYSRQANKLKKNCEDHDFITKNFKNSTSSSPTQHMIVRQLISGISHHFNNLLMGIWGNATLIRMQLDPVDPRYVHVEQMERLIQSGAFLIHMVLGYLGERRTVAKQMRLNQLISEIRNETGLDNGIDDPWDFEARLKWASRVQRPRMIASSTARVLEVLFQGIEKHCREILALKDIDITNKKKLSTIDSLVERGLDITCKLRLYAGDFPKNQKSRIRFGPMAKRLLTRLSVRFPNIEIHSQISDKLPTIIADRWQLEWAFEEIIVNCANAMRNGGILKVTVQKLQEESPNVRCGVHTGGDYLVISVQDSGDGITARVKKRIFEPFFANPEIHGKKGLGLAAADGILRSLRGFIHLQSCPKLGSTFKLYLPFSDATLLTYPSNRKYKHVCAFKN